MLVATDAPEASVLPPPACGAPSFLAWLLSCAPLRSPRPAFSPNTSAIAVCVSRNRRRGNRPTRTPGSSGDSVSENDGSPGAKPTFSCAPLFRFSAASRLSVPFLNVASFGTAAASVPTVELSARAVALKLGFVTTPSGSSTPLSRFSFSSSFALAAAARRFSLSLATAASMTSYRRSRALVASTSGSLEVSACRTRSRRTSTATCQASSMASSPSLWMPRWSCSTQNR
mmetsp:Transcript_7290/g.30361  ORF Transcript_7290/g.30361 Transcript_7290/m.30361 type:complete len:229 (-) Transcript_7290:538-1224(-)